MHSFPLGRRYATEFPQRFAAVKMPSGRRARRQRRTMRETMPISLPRAARRIAVALAIAALPPAAAFAYSPTAPTAHGEADLDRHDTYRNRDGDTVHAPAHSKSGRAPEGATARCRDGAYSFSRHRRGTCSGHGGVAAWL
ncbi:DUF3761 domain-containing protein [Burkholderia pseudomallei]|nr:DUF3761 domain-containing protein [Burkholderia pseudomallei]MWA26207.1 DUF3761 domain-containing protein [Burkholderia pseudomallei]RXS78708.1 DUF3761 domain-containing protein [Burkholderia pseudomallei]